MRYISIILLFTLLNLQCMAQDKPTLLYFGDPMCSWCYGFSPELSEVLNELDGKVELEMVMGGLRPYNKQTMQELGDFLKHHWEEVGQRSGQKFQYDILNDHSFVYDTEPACRAVRVVRKLDPSKEFEFFKAVQTAFYYENKNTADVQTYLAIAKTLDINPTDFKKEFESEEMKALIRKDFEKSAEMGVRGFPSMILVDGNKNIMIANGYLPSEQVVQKINLFIEN